MWGLDGQMLIQVPTRGEGGRPGHPAHCGCRCGCRVPSEHHAPSRQAAHGQVGAGEAGVRWDDPVAVPALRLEQSHECCRPSRHRVAHDRDPTLVHWVRGEGCVRDLRLPISAIQGWIVFASRAISIPEWTQEEGSWVAVDSAIVTTTRVRNVHVMFTRHGRCSTRRMFACACVRVCVRTNAIPGFLSCHVKPCRWPSHEQVTFAAADASANIGAFTRNGRTETERQLQAVIGAAGSKAGHVLDELLSRSSLGPDDRAGVNGWRSAGFWNMRTRSGWTPRAGSEIEEAGASVDVLIAGR